MELSLNDQRIQVSNNATVRSIFFECHSLLPIDPDGGGIAVAVNGDVIPPNSWDVTSLAEGDDVLVVTAAQGG